MAVLSDAVLAVWFRVTLASGSQLRGKSRSNSLTARAVPPA